jgi:hypothetical protein
MNAQYTFQKGKEKRKEKQMNAQYTFQKGKKKEDEINAQYGALIILSVLSLHTIYTHLFFIRGLFNIFIRKVLFEWLFGALENMVTCWSIMSECLI